MGLQRLEAEYGGLLLLPDARQLATAAEAIAIDMQRLRSHLTGRCCVPQAPVTWHPYEGAISLLCGCKASMLSKFSILRGDEQRRGMV